MLVEVGGSSSCAVDVLLSCVVGNVVAMVIV